MMRRSPWLAGLGNLFYPPLGHVYAGQAWRGVLVCAAIAAINLVAFTALARPLGGVGLVLTALVLVAAVAFAVGDAALVARQQGSGYPLKWYNRWYVYLLIPGFVWAANQAIVSVIRAYIVQPFYVASGAMRPSLLIGDRFVLDKLAYRWQPPARGDVVVFRGPQQGITGVPVSPEENDWVKRVIGLPGDTVQVVPDAAMVDGKRAVQFLDEYAREPFSSFLGAKSHGLGVERGQAPEIRGSVIRVNGEPRIAVTPTGEAELRDSSLWVDGQQMTYVGGPAGYRTDRDLARFGSDPNVQGVVYYCGKSSDRPALIVLKGSQLSLRRGYVSVNGQALKEPYILETPRYEMPAYKVPPDHYFVLGDNRNDSNDSHAWGPLARDRITGLARTIWYSWDDQTGMRWERVGRPLN